MANLNKIKLLCDEKKVSLTDLAKHLGITYQGLNKAINGNSTTLETLEGIAAFFNVPMAVFFDETLSLGNAKELALIGEMNLVDLQNKEALLHLWMVVLEFSSTRFPALYKFIEKESPNEKTLKAAIAALRSCAAGFTIRS